MLVFSPGTGELAFLQGFLYYGFSGISGLTKQAAYGQCALYLEVTALQFIDE